MKTPPFKYTNIIKVHKTDWFVSEHEIKELRQYVYQDTPVKSGDIYGGLFLGIHHNDFNVYLSGGVKYRAVAICKTLKDLL